MIKGLSERIHWIGESILSMQKPYRQSEIHQGFHQIDGCNEEIGYVDEESYDETDKKVRKYNWN